MLFRSLRAMTKLPRKVEKMRQAQQGLEARMELGFTELQQLIDTTKQELIAKYREAAQGGNPATRYDGWASGVIRGAMPRPYSFLSASWLPGSLYYDTIAGAMRDAEFQYARDLLSSPEIRAVPGAVVEFGVFEGEWLAVLADHCETAGLGREIWGFDSFEGLPPPGEFDLDCWHAGQYAASFEAVRARLKCDRRRNIHLKKGWFADTLGQAEARSLAPIAFARIDCDLYEPARQCLDYLAPRLADGAVLVLDDWTWDLEKGETRAFKEWSERGAGLHFDMLCYNFNGHLYLKVTRA